MSAFLALRATAIRRTLPAARQFSTVLDDAAITAAAAAPAASAGKSVLQDALNATRPRNTWSKAEITELYETPLMELVFASVLYCPT